MKFLCGRQGAPCRPHTPPAHTARTAQPAAEHCPRAFPRALPPHARRGVPEPPRQDKTAAAALGERGSRPLAGGCRNFFIGPCFIRPCSGTARSARSRLKERGSARPLPPPRYTRGRRRRKIRPKASARFCCLCWKGYAVSAGRPRTWPRSSAGRRSGRRRSQWHGAVRRRSGRQP